MTPEAAEAKAVEAFAALGGDLIDPPSLMPAARPLDVSGEAVRSRLCVFSSASGTETALRPDLTLPVAELEAERRLSGETDERFYRYAARAFRLPAAPGHPMEFVQVGFERFGAEAGPDSDAAAFETVMNAINAVGAPVDQIVLGDLAVFDAVVAALDLPSTTQAALRRAFRLHGGVTNLLKAPDKKGTAPALVRPGTSQSDAEALVEQMLDLSGTPLVGGRSVSDIAARLREKASMAGADGLTDAARNVLKEAIAVHGAPQSALEQLHVLSKAHGLSGLDGALEALAKRFDLILKDQQAQQTVFDVTYGRRFNYYDGFVFEVFGPGAEHSTPMGAGGRYDSLVDRLSAGEASATGIGGVVRPERLATAMEAVQ